MKVSRYFVWVDRNIDTDASESGWKLRDMPKFDPAPAYKLFLMVHDILEHHPDDGPELKYEMMAFGASYFIRVFGGWERFQDNFSGRGYTTQFNDITYFLNENKWEIEHCDEPYHPDLVHGMVTCQNYFKERFDGIADYQKNMDAMKMSFRWISMGYRRAKARWKNHSSKEVCALFTNMEKAITKITKNGWGDNHTAHGDTMVVTFDTETLKFTVDHNLKSRNYIFGRICIKKTVKNILKFVENNRSPINA